MCFRKGRFSLDRSSLFDDEIDVIMQYNANVLKHLKSGVFLVSNRSVGVAVRTVVSCRF